MSTHSGSCFDEVPHCGQKQRWGGRMGSSRCVRGKRAGSEHGGSSFDHRFLAVWPWEIIELLWASASSSGENKDHSAHIAKKQDCFQVGFCKCQGVPRMPQTLLSRKRISAAGYSQVTSALEWHLSGVKQRHPFSFFMLWLPWLGENIHISPRRSASPWLKPDTDEPERSWGEWRGETEGHPRERSLCGETEQSWEQLGRECGRPCMSRWEEGAARGVGHAQEEVRGSSKTPS